MQVTCAEAGGVDEFFALDEAWQAWDAEHGTRWRLLHEEATMERDLEHREQAGLEEGEWPADPPGWEIVSSLSAET